MAVVGYRSATIATAPGRDTNWSIDPEWSFVPHLDTASHLLPEHIPRHPKLRCLPLNPRNNERAMDMVGKEKVLDDLVAHPFLDQLWRPGFWGRPSGRLIVLRLPVVWNLAQKFTVLFLGLITAINPYLLETQLHLCKLADHPCGPQSECLVVKLLPSLCQTLGLIILVC
jgi:hypothetical protein